VAKTILVVANETLGGAALLARIKEKVAAEEGARVVVCVPRTNPRQGNIIYDEAVFDAAQVRIDLARKIMREEGIEAIGEVGDPDPYTATMDAIAEYRPDEIVISTYPAASSGWLRRDLIERIAEATQIPVEHLVVDLDQEGLPFGVTLVVANPGHRYPLACREDRERLGVRLLAGPLAGAMCPIFQTSANLSGEPPPQRFGAVPEAIVAAADLAIDGGELTGLPSTVVDIAAIEADGGWEVLREGALSAGDLGAAMASVGLG